MVTMADILPDFTLKRSSRAKHVRITVTRYGELIVTVPYAFNIKKLPAILDQKKAWINKSILKLKQQVDTDLPDGVLENVLQIPTQIKLKAIDAVYNVRIAASEKEQGEMHRYPDSETLDLLTPPTHNQPFIQKLSETDKGLLDPGSGCNKIKITETDKETLLIQIDFWDQEVIVCGLNSWLTKKAKQILIPWLLSLANERSLPVKSVSIRSQRTRWGSCSKSGTISLNKALLFLPPYLVTHIMLHELCHITEMNHSKRFWDLLEYEDQNTEMAKRELKNIWHTIPLWAVSR